MSGASYYRNKGLTKTIVVYLSKPTYQKLARIARKHEWSMQKVVRRILDKALETSGADLLDNTEIEEIRKIQARLKNL